MNSRAQSTLVITGGQGDLARAISQQFHTHAWQIHAPARDELDVSQPSSVSSFFKNHHPDLLICNAGTVRDAPLAKLSPDDWQHVIDVNFHGAHRCAKAALEHMIHRQAGHILFISSQSAIHPPVGQSAYATAKAALLGLTRDLATQAGPHNIRINAILPGFLETKMTAPLSSTRKDTVRASHTLGRFNTPEAVARFIWHLHHDLPHTSGQTFQLDSRTI